LKMIPIDSELDALEILYEEVEARLDGQYQSILAGSPPDPVEERKAAGLERRVVEAESRIARLASEGGAAVTGSGQTASRAARLRMRAQHLMDLMERNMAHYRHIRAAACESLRELDRGTRYLDSVREKRENQPKFIDARE